MWLEFEAGDVSRPIWVGCWWSSSKLPTDEEGADATPDLKILRSEQGLMLALHDDSQVIAVSDANGSNLLKIEVQSGQITVKARTKVVVDAPQIELVANASHRGGVRRQPADLPEPGRHELQHAHAPGPDGRAVPGDADAAGRAAVAADARHAVDGSKGGMTR